MASGKQLLAQTPVRMFLAGYPGSGKTGSIASLLNAGFKVRMLDFDNNYMSLVNWADPKALNNLDILTFQDHMRMGARYIEPVGIPSAFNNSMKAMQDWKTKDEKGNEVSLGASRDWGPDTVVVLDSLTSMGEAAFRRARKMMNKTPENTTRQVWGMAVDDQLNMLKLMAAEKNHFHLIVLAHLTMISPEEVEVTDDELTKGIKRDIGEMMGTKFFPRAVTKNFSTVIHKELPTMVLAEQSVKLNKVQRVIKTQDPHIDLKVPAKNVKPEYPIDTGLLDIFEALGAKPPKS